MNVSPQCFRRHRCHAEEAAIMTIAVILCPTLQSLHGLRGVDVIVRCWRECKKASAKWGEVDTSLLYLRYRIGSR